MVHGWCTCVKHRLTQIAERVAGPTSGSKNINIWTLSSASGVDKYAPRYLWCGAACVCAWQPPALVYKSSSVLQVRGSSCTDLSFLPLYAQPVFSLARCRPTNSRTNQTRRTHNAKLLIFTSTFHNFSLDKQLRIIFARISNAFESVLKIIKENYKLFCLDRTQLFGRLTNRILEINWIYISFSWNTGAVCCG